MEIGLTQQELAKKAAVTQKTISRIEGADIGVRRSTLAKVFRALRINKKDLAESEIEAADEEGTVTIIF